MKALSYLWVICCTMVAGATAVAQTNTAGLVGNCRSIFFGPMTRNDAALGFVATYLTTYDGRRDVAPLGYSNPIRFSGEVRTNSLDTRLYEADYMEFAQGVAREYGSLLVELPMTDSDGNGLPDVVQFNKAVNLTTGGNLVIDAPFQTVDSFTLNMARAANQLAGSYSVYRNSEASTSFGSIQLLNMSGAVTYARSPGTISFNFAVTDPLGTTRNVSGSANYSVINANQILLPEFSVSASGGPTYTFLAGTTLNRSGTLYLGNAKLTDGIPETYWADATNWVIEINDTNDWDSNSIPDLSDAIPSPPFFLAQPQSMTGVLSSNVTFTLSASGSMPLKYQWQFYGTNLPGRTSAALTLTNVQFANAGPYRCVVSNGGGSATSDPATLTVIFPPTITDHPMDISVILGSSAQFNVAAIGTDPLYYQWRHEGTNLPGAVDAILFIPSAQLQHEGLYSVVVSNAAGKATSSNARLTVVVPAKITGHPQSVSVATGANVMFSVVAEGNPLPAYRWMRNGTNVPGGTAATLTLPSVQSASQGIFNVRVSNAGATLFSSNATLYIGWPLTLTNFIRETSGTVRVDLIGPPNTSYALERSANLSNWVSIATNPAPRGILQFTDPGSESARFYRAKIP
jgi:hypothetical protein